MMKKLIKRINCSRLLAWLMASTILLLLIMVLIPMLLLLPWLKMLICLQEFILSHINWVGWMKMVVFGWENKHYSLFELVGIKINFGVMFYLWVLVLFFWEDHSNMIEKCYIMARITSKLCSWMGHDMAYYLWSQRSHYKRSLHHQQCLKLIVLAIVCVLALAGMK